MCNTQTCAHMPPRPAHTDVFFTKTGIENIFGTGHAAEDPAASERAGPTAAD